jgi:excisionase family DNA binding protein
MKSQFTEFDIVQMPGSTPELSKLAQGAVPSTARSRRPKAAVRTTASSGYAHGLSAEKHAGTPPDERFFTIREVAERLDVATRTVRRWIKSGDLVAHRFGGAVRIAESDLKAFLARHRDP